MGLKNRLRRFPHVSDLFPRFPVFVRAFLLEAAGFLMCSQPMFKEQIWANTGFGSGLSHQIFGRFASLRGSALLAWGACFAGFTAPAWGAEKNGSSVQVPFRRVAAQEYQNFLKNWDDVKTPLFCAVMNSAGRYEAWFHPAPLNRAHKSFGPAPAVFEREQFLVVARVSPGGESVDALFGVDRVEESGLDVRFFYQFHAPSESSSYTIKAHLALRIPQKAYRRAVFVENGAQVAVLDLAAGIWSVPRPPDALGKAPAGRK